jgi:hypothetical protein
MEIAKIDIDALLEESSDLEDDTASVEIVHVELDLFLETN